MARDKQNYTYGNSPEFTFETLRAGVPIAQGTETVGRVEIDADAYSDALDDINASFKIVTDKATGKTFEIAVANLDATEDTVDVEISTFNSSISNNDGNAREFALHAASHPERRRVYIASPGNGGSSHLGRDERLYARKTGSFVNGLGEPIPTMGALARILAQEDLTVSRLATDSAGGAYATALMSALEEGQVSHAYLKSRPGIMEHPNRFAWAARFFVGENLEGPRHNRETQDPWRSTAEGTAAVKARLTNVYNDENRGQWSNTAAVKNGGLAKIWADMETFSRAGAAHDTVFAFKNQPELQLTHHLPFGDRLYTPDIRSGAEEYLKKTRAMMLWMADIALGTPDSVASLEVAFIPGTHHDHSAYPTLRQSIETYAFSK